MLTCTDMSIRAIGNALYQYATLFGIGKKLGLEIRIPDGNNHVHTLTGQHIIQLKEIFNITTPFLSEEERSAIQYEYIEKRIGTVPSFEANSNSINEIKDNTNLIGFYNSERYFREYKEELLKELIFLPKWIDAAHNEFNNLNLNPNQCIFIHRRLGDYERLQQYHPILPYDYYLMAVNYIATKCDISKYKLLFFSDDIQKCKAEFNNNSIYFIDNSKYKKYAHIIDICMMSMCSKAVIANSTFSLWGAYLGNQKDIVVFPSLWLGPAYEYKNLCDIDGWIKI